MAGGGNLKRSHDASLQVGMEANAVPSIVVTTAVERSRAQSTTARELLSCAIAKAAQDTKRVMRLFDRW